MNLFFEESGDFKVGAVLSQQGEAYQVETPTGKRTKVRARDVLLQFETPSPAELMAQEQNLAAEIDLPAAPYIDGKFRKGNGPMMETINPATGDVLTKISTATAKDVDLAVTKARELVKVETLVDVRSKSRFGRGDMGVNAKRIREYSDKLMAQVKPPEA